MVLQWNFTKTTPLIWLLLWVEDEYSIIEIEVFFLFFKKSNILNCISVLVINMTNIYRGDGV